MCSPTTNLVHLVFLNYRNFAEGFPTERSFLFFNNYRNIPPKNLCSPTENLLHFNFFYSMKIFRVIAYGFPTERTFLIFLILFKNSAEKSLSIHSGNLVHFKQKLIHEKLLMDCQRIPDGRNFFNFLIFI